MQILEDTVFDEVAYGPRAKKLTEATIERQVNEALEAMGLTELKGEYPRLLSFGQKRRLGVAAALALNPRTLILDEITNGQDALEKEAMMSYLQAINEKRGITIVLISHDMILCAAMLSALLYCITASWFTTVRRQSCLTVASL